MSRWARGTLATRTRALGGCPPGARRREKRCWIDLRVFRLPSRPRRRAPFRAAGHGARCPGRTYDDPTHSPSAAFVVGMGSRFMVDLRGLVATLAGGARSISHCFDCHRCASGPPTPPAHRKNTKSTLTNAHTACEPHPRRLRRIARFFPHSWGSPCSRLVERTDDPVDDPCAAREDALRVDLHHVGLCGVPRALPPLPHHPSIWLVLSSLRV